MIYFVAPYRRPVVLERECAGYLSVASPSDSRMLLVCDGPLAFSTRDSHSSTDLSDVPVIVTKLILHKVPKNTCNNSPATGITIFLRNIGNYEYVTFIVNRLEKKVK